MGSALGGKKKHCPNGPNGWSQILVLFLRKKTVPKCRENAVRKLLWKPNLVAQESHSPLTAHLMMHAQLYF